MGENAIEQKSTRDDAFAPMSDSANSTVDRFLESIRDHEIAPRTSHEQQESKQEKQQATESTPAAENQQDSEGQQDSKQETQPETLVPQNAIQDSDVKQELKPETIQPTDPPQEIQPQTDSEESQNRQTQVEAVRQVAAQAESDITKQGPLDSTANLPKINFDLNGKPTQVENRDQTDIDLINPSTDSNFRPVTSQEIQLWVESQKPKPQESKTAGLSLDEVKDGITGGFGKIGLISPTLSFTTSATEADVNAIADGIVKATVENKESERALQDQINEANDLDSFTSRISGVASALGIGWGVSKAAGGLPGVARIPAVIATAIAGGGALSNEMAGRDILDTKGFLSTAFDTGVVYGTYKALSAVPANQAVSAEVLTKAGIDPTKNVLANQLGNELKFHQHKLEVEAWKAMDKNKLMQAEYFKMLIGSFVSPLAALSGKANMTYLEKGPLLSWEADKLIRSRFNVWNYTPFRREIDGIKYVGMGGEKTQLALIDGIAKNAKANKMFTPVNDYAMSIGEFNTRTMASRLYGVTAAGFAFGTTHKAGDILLSDKPNNKTLSQNLTDMVKEGASTAYYAPLVAINLRHGIGPAFGTSIVLGAKGASSVEHHYQQKNYEGLKQLGEEREKARQRQLEQKRTDEEDAAAKRSLQQNFGQSLQSLQR